MYQESSSCTLYTVSLLALKLIYYIAQAGKLLRQSVIALAICICFQNNTEGSSEEYFK